MPKNKGKGGESPLFLVAFQSSLGVCLTRRNQGKIEEVGSPVPLVLFNSKFLLGGKNENDNMKRELVFKEEHVLPRSDQIHKLKN